MHFNPCRDPHGNLGLPPRNVFFLKKMRFELDLKEATKGHRVVERDVGSFPLMSEGAKKGQQGKGTEKSST